MSIEAQEQSNQESGGAWGRLRNGLRKTRAVLTTDLSDLFQGTARVDAATLEELETRLLMADVGVDTTRTVIDSLKAAGTEPGTGLNALRDTLIRELHAVEAPLFIFPGDHQPFVILVAGVNGVGKTTTIGKLAHYFNDTGQSTMLAAGDTFRAAAIEQLQEWGKRVSAPVIAHKSGADAAAVIYDALQSARSRKTDILIADTAGRLHTKHNLMEELKKIRRTIGKFDPEVPVETLMVIDAGTGQNAIAQAREFHQAIGLGGLVLTKLDGTARGGVVFALARQLGIPIRFIGVGEQLYDLRPFAAEPFVDALLQA